MWCSLVAIGGLLLAAYSLHIGHRRPSDRDMLETITRWLEDR